MGTCESAANGRVNSEDAIGFLSTLGQIGLSGLTERHEAEMLAAGINGTVETA